LECRQQELFPDDSMRWHPRHLAGLVERLSSRLGPLAVTRARLRPEAQPELACRYDAVVQTKRARKSPTAAAGSDLPPRPLRLLTKPLRLTVMSIVPDGPPVQLQMSGQRQQIAHCWGPERIETGWWRGRAVGRDYYRVETAAGHRLWLFRRLRDDRWFLHGTFD
jgi:protein ImuB